MSCPSPIATVPPRSLPSSPASPSMAPSPAPASIRTTSPSMASMSTTASTGQFGAIVGNAPVDSVQEFRGITAGELATAGEGGGGQYELVTSSGTNQFHGPLVEYHRDTDLEANNWFNNNDGVARPPLIRNQFGGNVGGPILKNKLFFFFDYNGRRDTLSNLVERTVPMDCFRNGTISYINSGGTTSTLNSAQVAAHDPSGIGFDQDLPHLRRQALSGSQRPLRRGRRHHQHRGLPFQRPLPLRRERLRRAHRLQPHQHHEALHRRPRCPHQQHPGGDPVPR